MAPRYTSLADYLEKTGMSRAELARRIGVSAGQVSQYVRRNHSPNLDTALRIVKVTGIPIERLTARE